MKLKGINHIGLVTGDMEKTIRFWRDIIGLRIVAGYGEKGYRQYFFEISEGVMISFFQWDGAEPVEDKDPGRSVKGPIVFDHICIELDSEESLWTMKSRLEESNNWVTEVIDNGFIYSIFTTDPNNIQVELCCRIKDIDINKEGRVVDKSPPNALLEGCEPVVERSQKPAVNRDERRIYPGPLRKMVE